VAPGIGPDAVKLVIDITARICSCQVATAVSPPRALLDVRVILNYRSVRERRIVHVPRELFAARTKENDVVTTTVSEGVILRARAFPSNLVAKVLRAEYGVEKHL
jgi:hypothetical protein